MHQIVGTNGTNLVPRVSHLTAQGGGKIRDPGNEVETEHTANNASGFSFSKDVLTRDSM